MWLLKRAAKEEDFSSQNLEAALKGFEGCTRKGHMDLLGEVPLRANPRSWPIQEARMFKGGGDGTSITCLGQLTILEEEGQELHN